MADTNEQDIRRGGLTLEQYAEAEAFVRHYDGDERSEVLAVLGIEPDQWHEASTEWGTMINRALEVGRQDLALSFAAAYQSARRTLEEELLPLAARRPPESVAKRPALSSPPGTPPATDMARPVSLPVSPDPAPSVDPTSREPVPTLGVDETALAVPIVDRPATPFAGSAPPPDSALADLGPEPNGVLDETAEVSIVHLAEAALPFGPAKSQPTPGERAELTVEQYASLRAELATFPEHRQRSLTRYGIPDDDAAAVLDDEWAERFAADPELEARWRFRHDRFCDWLREQGPDALESR